MSLPTARALAGLGAAFAYPRPGYRDALRSCLQEIAATNPDAAAEVRAFCDGIAGLAHWELEDVYTQSFDLNPLATLEVGWHLYGEQYRRGRFLVRSRELLAQVGIDEAGELPDHLMSLLPAVGRLERTEAATLSAACLLPAIDKMLAGLAKKENPFEHLLKAVRLSLEPLAAEAPELPSPAVSPDLVQIGAADRLPPRKGAVP